MDKKIENILNLYENILSSKEIILESDIQGIDELVYNPATKEGGDIGYGYDNGNKVNGITWNGHNDHLHISFTDKKTAISVINKADAMGLRTTENPYAKKDPNKKVDNVHSNGSFHYKNFPGTPLVGMAVDISGNQSKITDLIEWINKTYSSVSSNNTDNASTDTTNDDEEESYEGGIMSTFASNVANSILPSGGKSINVLKTLGITENVNRIKKLL